MIGHKGLQPVMADGLKINTYNYSIPVPAMLMHDGQLREFFYTGPAPGGPVIYDHPLALILIQRLHLAIQVWKLIFHCPGLK